MLGALHLQLLQHQPLENLLAEHVLGRHFLLLLPEAFADGGHLLVELALEHHALDSRFARNGSRHPVQQLAGGGQITGLGMRNRGQQQGRHEREKKPLH